MANPLNISSLSNPTLISSARNQLTSQVTNKVKTTILSKADELKNKIEELAKKRISVTVFEHMRNVFNYGLNEKKNIKTIIDKKTFIKDMVNKIGKTKNNEFIGILSIWLLFIRS
jgi:hypothetical protein